MSLQHSSSAGRVPDQRTDSHRVVLGKVTTVHGLLGWVKVYSWTQPVTNIFAYPKWWLRFPNGCLEQVEVAQTRLQGNGLAVRFNNCHNREQALLYKDSDVLVDTAELPEPVSGEYYWYELEGLTVMTEIDDVSVNMGKISHLLDTGANDVVVVHPTKDSIDTKERLIPWIDREVIRAVNLDDRLLQVCWDPDF